MKWIVFTLLLVNLVVFVWHFQPASARKSSLVNDQLTRLVLLNEYEQQLQLEGNNISQSRCYSLGPFSRRDSFNKARNILDEAGVKTFGRVSSDSVRNGYWVMLPASRSRNQAILQIEKLREQGIKDYFLVAAGEMMNAISLGVFSKPKLAKRRKDHVQKKGFNAIIKKIAIPNRVYWIEWPAHSRPQPKNEMLDSLRSRFDGIGQTEKSCISAKRS